jgi:hypothetical protein
VTEGERRCSVLQGKTKRAYNQLMTGAVLLLDGSWREGQSNYGNVPCAMKPTPKSQTIKYISLIQQLNIYIYKYK